MKYIKLKYFKMSFSQSLRKEMYMDQNAIVGLGALAILLIYWGSITLIKRKRKIALTEKRKI